MSSALRSSLLRSVLSRGARTSARAPSSNYRFLPAFASTSATPVSGASFITPESSRPVRFPWPSRGPGVEPISAWVPSSLAPVSELQSLIQENDRLTKRVEELETQRRDTETQSNQNAMNKAQATIASVNRAVTRHASTRSGNAPTETFDTSDPVDLTELSRGDLRDMLKTAKRARKTACSQIRQSKSEVFSMRPTSARSSLESGKGAMRSYEAGCKAKDDANTVITTVRAELESRRSGTRKLRWWETETGAALAETRRDLNRAETRVQGHVESGRERDTLLSEVNTARTSIAQQIRAYKSQYSQSGGQFTVS